MGVKMRLRRWLGVLTTGAADDPPTARDRANARWLRIEAPGMSLATSGAPSFLPLFAMQLGATNAMVGWLTSGAALLNLLWLIPCSRIMQRSKAYLHPMLAAIVAQRLLLVLAAGIPFLPAEWRAWGAVAATMALAVANTTWGVAIDSSSSELVSPRHFARILGQRWAIGSFAMVIGAYLLGRLLEAVAYPWNYQLLFAGVGLLGLSSYALVGRLQYPAKSPGGTARGAPAAPFQWRAALRRYRAFILFEAGIFVTYLASFAAIPLYRIYWVRDLGAAGGWIGALTAASAVGVGVGNLLWGQWSEARRDRRLCLTAGLGVMALYPWLTAAFHALPALAAGVTLAGFFSAGNEMILFKRLVQMTPLDRRPTFLAAHNIVLNVAGVAGPLLSTPAADAWGIRPVLACIGGLGAIGVIAIYGWGWAKLGEATPTAAGMG
jgi:MFS family permease